MIKNKLYDEDLIYAVSQLDPSYFNQKRILITGATGMIGSCIIDILLKMCETANIECSILAAGRNEEKFKKRFFNISEKSGLEFIKMDFSKEQNTAPLDVDFIIHGAGNADPISFTEYPVDTMLSNIIGTKSLIEHGMAGTLKKFLYISSGEVYGQPNEHMDDFDENYSGYLNYLSPRSCYPSSKRATEVLCQSYISQFDLKCLIVRPCHIFGPTMTEKDSRAVSEFLRSAASEKDIILKSKGTLERSHCYVVDAAMAILLVLIKGKIGQPYNIADPAYQMTISEFAKTAAAAGNCNVVFNLPSDTEKRGYSSVKRAVLKSDLIQKLGWKPRQLSGSKIERSVNILKNNR